MTVDTHCPPPREILSRWAPDPFLHLGADRIYSPLQDRLLVNGDPAYALLEAWLSGKDPTNDVEPALLQQLREEGWLVDLDSNDHARSFRLKYVALETHTVCNQRCYFCPVSVAPRASYFMPTELFDSIVLQLTAYRDTLEAVWLMLYNEPTLDRRLVDQCLSLSSAGLPAAVNTNASGLSPDKVDALVAGGPLRFLSINLSTFDRQRYARDRGVDQLDQVLSNLDYAKDRAVAEEMVVVVLGEADDAHRRELEEAERRFGGSRFSIQSGEIMDRAGYLAVGRKVAEHDPRPLRGCENVGSRPLQHLHITPQGQVVFCCQDYDETHIVGDLHRESVAEVLAGDAIAALRRQAYGLEAPGDDFLCDNCVFALR